MGALRRALTEHRRLALAVVVLALLVRAVVPPGFMLGGGAMTLTVQVCADASGGHLTRAIVVPREGKPAEAGKHVPPCAFSSLAAMGLGNAAPALIAAALAFLLALAFAARPIPGLARPTFLRPPLRAPPARG